MLTILNASKRVMAVTLSGAFTSETCRHNCRSRMPHVLSTTPQRSPQDQNDDVLPMGECRLFIDQRQTSAKSASPHTAQLTHASHGVFPAKA